MTQAKGTLLLGHPRSGTTLLRRLLGAHPDVLAPPELHVFGACARMLREDTNALGLNVGMLSGLAFAGFEDADILARMRALPFGLLNELAEKAGKSQWLEKTAFDIFELDGIDRLCGDHVSYLGIIRHPVDVALSTIDFCTDMGRYPSVLHPYVAQHPDPLDAFLHSWADTTRALMALGERRPEQVTICRYEDLVADSEGLTDDLFAAMGLTPHTTAQALEGDPDGFVDSKAFQSTKVVKDRQARWQRLPDARLAAMTPIVGELMEMLGYDPLPDVPPRSQDDARRAYLMGLAQKPSR